MVSSAPAVDKLCDLEQPQEDVQRFRKDVLECEDDFLILFRRDVVGSELRDAHKESLDEGEPE